MSARGFDRPRSRGRALLLASLLMTLPSLAEAAPSDQQSARDAYDQGTRAHQRGDDAEAAADFARADALSPNPTALESGLLAATLADKPEIAMTLVDRAERRGNLTPSLQRAVEAARKKFAARVAQIEVRCTAPGCSATLDGLPAALGVRAFVVAGEHVVEIDVHGKTARETVRVEAGGEVVVAPPAGNPAPIAPEKGGLAPGWFFVALGATAVTGALTIGSGIDTASKHAAVEKSFDAAAVASGKSAQTRTNVLLGTTIALGVGAGALGLFAVRWKGSATRPASEASIELAPAFGGARLGGTFW